MPVSREDVIAAYEMILGRSPESDEVVAAHARSHADRKALGLSFLASEEADLRRTVARNGDWLMLLRMGLDREDLALLSAFVAPDRSAAPGVFVDFLGQRTRATFVHNGAAIDGVLGGLPFPADFHAEAAEWVAFLKVLTAARGGFVAAELGAGWGPWTAAAYAVAAKLGLSPVKLHAVEADPDLFVRLRQHLEDNAVPQEVLDLRQAVVSVEAGERLWSPRGAGSTDYGASAPAEGEMQDYRGLEIPDRIAVPSLPLDAFLREEPVWDLIHIDLQGSEEELCRAAMQALTERVRHVIVATHSKALDAGCFEAFHEAGWACLMNSAPIVSHAAWMPTLQSMTRIDGMQLWRNPRLVP